MPSLFINNWIHSIEMGIDYWYTNYPSPIFAISPLPGLPVTDNHVLSHCITSCCPDQAGLASISFHHFPEPYYGNPDDAVTKSAVVLFYNPGPQGEDQAHPMINPQSAFNFNYQNSGYSYYTLSTQLAFCPATVNSFLNPKSLQLQQMLVNVLANFPQLPALFIDLIPWHSQRFFGLNNNRMMQGNVIAEIWRNVFLPAILNAKNTLVSQLCKKTIVLFAVGARYSTDSILEMLGFDDITPTFSNCPNIVYHNNELRLPNPQNGIAGKIKVWGISKVQLIERIETHITEEAKENVADILNSYERVVVINQWTMAQNMNILGVSGQAIINYIFLNL